MVAGLYHPQFGDLIIKRFHRVVNLRTGGSITCGGLTVIARTLVKQSPRDTPFYGRILPFDPAEPSGHAHVMFSPEWVTGPDDIALADPISEMVWVLPLNLPPPLHPRRLQQASHLHYGGPSLSTLHPDYTDATPLSYIQPDPMQTDFPDEPQYTQPPHPDPNSPFTYRHYLDLHQDIASL
ncbi:unnamed protein product [Lactuca saligna]|uniref:Uncharacterized protein n=1 Tax=Lactuca saligna TaxID=75948 RepID=A0AA35VI24_LACSI|nr:unnamed protein product [Lactuca saligna]